jgi:hypothetical protein
MRGFAVWGLLAGLVGACTLTPQEETHDVAAILCKCEVPDVPTLQQQCVDQLVSVIGTVPDACYDCVNRYQTTCSMIEAQCENACTVNTPGGP